MFSSNQKLIVTGDENKSLKKLLEYIFYVHNNYATSYYFKEGVIVFNIGYSSEKTEYIKIDKEDEKNVELFVNLIGAFLSKSSTKKFYDYQFEEGDGSYHYGWELEYINDSFPSRIEIRPFKTFYHK